MEGEGGDEDARILVIGAVVGLLLGSAPAAHADPYEHGESDTVTLTGT